MRWLYYSVLLLALVVTAIYATLWTLEDTMLLHPAVCQRYLSYEPNTVIPIHLKSGGLLLHRPQPQQTTSLSIQPRAVVCLHGNAGNLDGMANLAQMFLDRSYEVYLLEPAGYGVCGRDAKGERVAPTTETLVRDLHEAWEQIPTRSRRDAILWGFSMGGGIICQFLRTCPEGDLPAQVVLVNTYYDLPMLVRDLFPLPGVAHVMKTRWNAEEGLQRFCQAKQGSTGKVLIVAAADDELIPIKHAHRLLSSIPNNSMRQLIILPNGQHNNSVERHANLWLPAILPAVPDSVGIKDVA